MDTVDGNNTRIFISYSHKDQEMTKRLIEHMGGIKNDMWYDHMITAGTVWSEEIEINLNQANIILFLVSSSFKASDYCSNIEVPRAMERHNRREAQVIPILLRHTYWKDTLYGNLQCLPTGSIPVTKWKDKDEAFANIVDGIWRVIETQSYANKGDILFNCQDFGGAFTAYKKAIEADRENSFLYEKKGDAAFNLGLSYSKEAEEAYDQSIMLNTSKRKNAVLWDKKADIFFSMSRPDEKAMLDAHNKMLEAYDTSYNLMLEVRNEIVESDAERDPGDLSYTKQFLMGSMRAKGNRLVEIGESEKALEAYEQAIRWEPDEYYLYVERGDVFCKINRFKDAYVDYNRAIYGLGASASIVTLAKERVEKILRYLKDMEKQKKEILACQECDGEEGQGKT